MNKEWFDKLRQSHQKAYETFSMPEFLNLFKGLTFKYSDSAHFILEFLQNADDAGATEVEMQLYADRFVFIHNGTDRFTLSNPDTVKEDKEAGKLGDINSITGINFSSKNFENEIKRNKIGKFGVGFKAVYQYTTTPYIYDDPYCFKITNFIVPELIEDCSLQQSGKTVFVIPFDKKEIEPSLVYNHIKNQLLELRHPQLFLNNLMTIKWSTDDGNNGIIDKIKEKEYLNYSVFQNYYNIIPILYKIKTNEKVEQILMMSRKWNDSLNICIGYFIDEKGQIDTKFTRNVYCFFPTKVRIGTCFVIHAPFLLTESRETILKDEEINISLFKELAKLAADSLRVLMHIGIIEGKRLLNDNIIQITKNYLESIFTKPRYNWQGNDYTKIFNEQYQNVLQSHSLFLTRDAAYMSLNRGCWAPQEIRGLLSVSQLEELTKYNKRNFILFSSPQFYVEEFSKRLSLDIYLLTAEELAKLLTPSFMKSQTEEWIEHLYKYVLDYRLVEIYEINKGRSSEAVMRHAPIIKVETGNFVPAIENGKLNVFLDDGSDISQECIINKSLYEKSENFRKVIEKLGIRKPDKISLLENKFGRIERLDQKGHNDLLVQIVEFFNSESRENKSRLINLLKGKAKFRCSWVNAIHADTSVLEELYRSYFGTELPSSSSVLVESSKMYFGKELYEYFKHTNFDSAYFLYEAYYSEALKTISIDDLNSLFSELGINNKPRIIINSKLTNEEAHELNKQKCTRYWCNKVGIEGLDDILNFITNHPDCKSLSLYVWNMLSNYVLEGKDIFKQDELVWFYRTEHIIYKPSTLVRTLRMRKWFCIDGKNKSIEDGVYREDLLNNGYLANEELFKQLGIEKSPNVQEEEIIATMSAEAQKSFKLGDVAQNYVDDPEELEKLLKFAIEAKAAKEKKEQQATSGETNRPPQSSYPTSTGTGHSKPLTDKDFEPTEPNDGNKGPKGTSGGNKEPKKDESTAKIADTLAGFDEKYEMQRKDLERVEELREQCKPEDKYKYSWFKALMELEAMSYGTTEDAAKVRKSINILFKRVAFIPERHDLLVLEDASKYIPAIIEDIDGITVRFTLRGGATKDVTFDVASVRDNRLLLKGNTDAGKFIDSIRDNASLIDKATIDIDKPIEIIKNWKRLIDNLENLGFSDEESLKESLCKDIKFIFGPPGTGKTTLLARRIKKLIEDNERCKILVLTPTNKACDVLAEKILDECPEDYTWLWRFVSTMSQRLEDAGIVRGRQFDISSQEKVCLVSTMARYAFDSLNNVPINSMNWDYVIIDEASMIPLYQIITPLFNYNISNIVIAGDPFQIEPIVKMEEWMGENIYSIVNLNDFKLHTTEPVQYDVECLMTQYRSIPVVGEIYNNYMYGGELSHNRTSDKHRLLKTGLEENPLNIISFPVTNESIFEAHRLSGSNIHVYSVIFTVEMLNYITDNLNAEHPGQEIRIGVVSPYSSEVQAIQKMYNQCSEYRENIEVLFGTSHGFQGDECDIMIVVVNPPASGMVRAADLTFINKPNILNVAISRAKDYLYVLMPDRVYKHFDKMTQLKELGDLMMKGNCKSYTSFQIEQRIFGNSGFIEGNTFVSSHQTTNVYSNSSAKYDIRIDENAIDITVN